jgi:hypothetical protein
MTRLPFRFQKSMKESQFWIIGSAMLRRFKGILWVLLALLLIGLYFRKSITTLKTGEYRRVGISGREGLVFSPDNKQFAYLWRDVLYRVGERWDSILTDSVEIHWAATAQPEKEQRVLLATADLRTMKGTLLHGKINGIEVDFAFSPDATQLAAVCVQSLLIIDVVTGQSRRLTYPKERFNGFHWLSEQEIAFSTMAEEDSSLWRLKLGKNAKRTLVCRYSGMGTLDEYEPLELSQMHWSPDGKYVIPQQSLISVLTGKVRTLPENLAEIYWRPDSSVILGEQWLHDEKTHLSTEKTLLIDAATGAVRDLTAPFKNVAEDLTLVGWTGDGQYFLAYTTSSYDQVGNQLTEEHGYLLQLQPFKVVLKTDEILRASPLPGWVFLQGGDTMTWLNYEGTRKAPLNGWANDWTWSADGQYAAGIVDGKVSLFQPTLPK